MGRFIDGGEKPVPFSELHPEKFDPVRLLDPADPRDAKALKAMRQEFMNEAVPEQPARQLHGNKRRR